MDEGPVLGKGLSDGLGAVVAETVGGEMESLQNAELGSEEVVEGLCALEGDAVGREVQDAETVVFEGELLDGVDGVAVELVLAQTQLLQAAVHLQHLREVDGALLPDAAVVWRVQTHCPQRAIVPVQHTRHADHSVDVQSVVSQVQLLQRSPLLLAA